MDPTVRVMGVRVWMTAGGFGRGPTWIVAGVAVTLDMTLPFRDVVL
jgi:hypothetical protein